MIRIKPFLAALVMIHLLVLPVSAQILSMTRIGEGAVSPDVGNHSYLWFQKVTVSATPAPGWVFDRWEGELAGESNPCTVKMNENMTASAVFRPLDENPSNALVRYVGKFDPATQATLVDEDTHLGWNGYTMELTSQAWRSDEEVDRPLWTHDLSVIVPWFTDEQCLFLINGGSNPVKLQGPDSTIAAAALALGMTYVQLDQIPNQPLYFTDEDNVKRKEDMILAYSLDKYLDTGDDEWPVHLAMVKSVVKAMDAVQVQVRPVEDFLLLGASKRGWTTWLTAAVDPRVKAMIPLVIDVLRLDKQVEHHWESYGFYTDAIQDYIDFDLFCRINDPGAEDLLQIVDPYSYKDVFTMPKLIINGSGDQFFLPDASKYYYDDIPGPKHLRYVPNASHYMESLLEDYVQILGVFRWGQEVMNDRSVPRYSWSLEPDGSIIVHTEDRPTKVLLWQATNPDARDFRMESFGAAYTGSLLSDQGGGTYVGYCPVPERGWTAYFVELTYGTQVYSTQINVVPDIEPYDGLHCTLDN